MAPTSTVAVVPHGISPEAASAHAETIGASYGDAVRAHVHANNGGHAVVLDADAATAASIVDADAYGQLIVASILSHQDGRTQLCDEYFTRNIGALAKLCEESETPPRLSAVDRASGRDKKVWQAVLGRRSFVGVYRCEERANCPAFYLVARVGRTPIGCDAQQYVRENCKTARDVATSRRLAQARRLARRNAQRLICEMAELLRVRVVRIADLGACPVRVDGPLPKIAVPTYHCEYNVTRIVTQSDDVESNADSDDQQADSDTNGDGSVTRVRDRVIYFNRCIDMAAAKDGIVMPIDPCSGLWVMRSLRPGIGHVRYAASSDSFPLGLGAGARRPGAKPAISHASAVNRFTWALKGEAGASTSTSTSALHPALASDAYASFSDERRQLVRAMCAGTQRLKLLPVIVRISEPEAAC